ncbi:MAG: GTP 3',8-cyclase MoaA [Alcanivoracaceae bacterium]|nr:GTP 3',8-cyclase MoaA [Alcanivoracaceae bacterium]
MNNITDKLDRPIKDLRISVMDTCNYRCPYCMPADKFTDDYQFLKPSERLSFEEIYRIVKVFAGFGVNKIRLTGGEPLLRKNLPQLVAQLKTIKGIKDIALTTNGQLLQKQLPQLIEAGLDRVNISLDTIDKDLYYKMSGNKGHLKVVLDAIEFAQNTNLKSIKLNSVVQIGVNDNHIIPLLEKYQNTNVVVRFIEFMDVGTKNGWQQKSVLHFKDILQQIKNKWAIEPINPNYKGEVAARYKYKEHSGEIGFITSISKPFCRDCSRARLSADGKLYTCLFASKAYDLKKYLRNEDDQFLQQYIQNVWQNREDRYSEIRHEIKDNKNRIEMYVIGG